MADDAGCFEFKSQGLIGRYLFICVSRKRCGYKTMTDKPNIDWYRNEHLRIVELTQAEVAGDPRLKALIIRPIELSLSATLSPIELSLSDRPSPSRERDRVRVGSWGKTERGWVSVNPARRHADPAPWEEWLKEANRDAFFTLKRLRFQANEIWASGSEDEVLREKFTAAVETEYKLSIWAAREYLKNGLYGLTCSNGLDEEVAEDNNAWICRCR